MAQPRLTECPKAPKLLEDIEAAEKSLEAAEKSHEEAKKDREVAHKTALARDISLAEVWFWWTTNGGIANMIFFSGEVMAQLSVRAASAGVICEWLRFGRMYSILLTAFLDDPEPAETKTVFERLPRNEAELRVGIYMNNVVACWVKKLKLIEKAKEKKEKEKERKAEEKKNKAEEKKTSPPSAPALSNVAVGSESGSSARLPRNATQNVNYVEDAIQVPPTRRRTRSARATRQENPRETEALSPARRSVTSSNHDSEENVPEEDGYDVEDVIDVEDENGNDADSINGDGDLIFYKRRRLIKSYFCSFAVPVDTDVQGVVDTLKKCVPMVSVYGSRVRMGFQLKTPRNALNLKVASINSRK